MYPFALRQDRKTNRKRVFEMGSGFGYSAYWMAKALREPGASIICTDGSQENAEQAAAYLARGGIAERIDYRVGFFVVRKAFGECDWCKAVSPRKAEIIVDDFYFLSKM